MPGYSATARQASRPIGNAVDLRERRKLRDVLMEQYSQSERLTSWPLVGKLEIGAARREYDRQGELLRQYAQALPAIPISRCPLCGEVLRYAMDVFRMDGIWWFKDDIVGAPRPHEPHHRVVLGAIDIHGRFPRETREDGEVLPGPSEPFVVPRLLKMRGMVAVISHLDLPHGDTAYLIAYFNRRRFNPWHLHQHWLRESLTVNPEDCPHGRGGCNAATDPWDFVLEPWIARGKLQWVAPGDSRLRLRDTGRCPYLNLPGVRAPQSLARNEVATLPLLDGRPIDSFSG